jgi:hypothetical protein
MISIPEYGALSDKLVLPNKRWEHYGWEDVNDAIIEIMNSWAVGLYEGKFNRGD